MENFSKNKKFYLKVFGILLILMASLYGASFLFNEKKLASLAGYLLISTLFIAGFTLLLMNKLVIQFMSKKKNRKVVNIVILNLILIILFFLGNDAGFLELLMLLSGIVLLVLFLLPEKTINTIWEKLDL